MVNHGWTWAWLKSSKDIRLTTSWRRSLTTLKAVCCKLRSSSLRKVGQNEASGRKRERREEKKKEKCRGRTDTQEVCKQQWRVRQTEKIRGSAAVLEVRPDLSVSTYLLSWGLAKQNRLSPQVATNIYITTHRVLKSLSDLILHFKMDPIGLQLSCLAGRRWLSSRHPNAKLVQLQNPVWHLTSFKLDWTSTDIKKMFLEHDILPYTPFRTVCNA